MIMSRAITWQHLSKRPSRDLSPSLRRLARTQRGVEDGGCVYREQVEAKPRSPDKQLKKPKVGVHSNLTTHEGERTNSP